MSLDAFRFQISLALRGPAARVAAAMETARAACRVLEPGRARMLLVTSPLGIGDLDAVREMTRIARSAGARVDDASSMQLRIDAAPLDTRALRNFQRIVHKQAALIAHAVGRPERAFEVRVERDGAFAKRALVLALGPTLHGGELAAYVHLFLAIAARAIAARSTSSKARPFDAASARYDFRCALLRLGLVGESYRDAREQLLKRLPGSAAWKHGRPADEALRRAPRIDAAIAQTLG